MRLSFLGSARPIEPVVLSLPNGQPFLKQMYVDQGYDNYEVLCIGAAGGRGGKIGAVNWASSAFVYAGGGGGGGGLHRVTGTLSSLASSVAVVVGVVGSDGANGGSISTDTAANGTAGGYSSFGSTLCRASGGAGGVRARNQLVGTGGAGGIGNSISAGGGASAGVNGTFNGSIGSGGGGGSGVCAQWFPDTVQLGIWIYEGAGGRGNYNVSQDLDSTVNAGKSIYPYYAMPQFALEPYCGGGATARILNNQSYAYGSLHANGYGNPITGQGSGAVIIKLTAN